MSDIINIFLSLLIILGIPMLYSLVCFVSERRGNAKKTYLKYIFLFIIYYIFFTIFYFLFIYLSSELMSFIYYIFKKYINYTVSESTILFITFIISLLTYYISCSIIYITLCIKIMKKYLSFNDISLFFILKAIIDYIIISIIIKLDYHFNQIDPSLFVFYLVLFIILCWILFFMNINQSKNLIKNKIKSDRYFLEQDEKRRSSE